MEVSIGNNEKEESHTIEELVATTLQYAMKIGTALGKGVIKDGWFPCRRIFRKRNEGR